MDIDFFPPHCWRQDSRRDNRQACHILISGGFLFLWSQMLKESLHLLLTSGRSISLLKYLYDNTHLQWIALLLAGRTHKAEKGIFTIFVPMTATIHYKNEIPVP